MGKITIIINPFDAIILIKRKRKFIKLLENNLIRSTRADIPSASPELNTYMICVYICMI